MPGKRNLKSILKGFEVDRCIWSLALCSDWSGSTGLANRASVPEIGIFSDKWTVLVEFWSAVGVVNHAVSADAVPHRAIQGTHATALQWLLFAVTAIKDNTEGWSGSVHMFRGNMTLRGWHTISHITTQRHRHTERVQYIQTIKCLGALTHAHKARSYGFNTSIQGGSHGWMRRQHSGKGRQGGLATITSLIANCQGFKTKGNFKSL